MEVQSKDADCKTESEPGAKQPLASSSTLPSQVTQNSLQMVAEGGGQQFKISVSPLSKTLQGSTMAAVLVLNSAGQHQLCALPNSVVSSGGGGADHKVPVKLTKQQRIEKENLRAEALAKRQAEKEERRLRKEKEEREKQERKEKREAERKRKLEEQQLKTEVKKRKEDERMAAKRKREEEKMEVKRKKEEVKHQVELQEQEKMRKKNLSKQLLMNFLSKKDNSECSTRGNTPPTEPLRQSPVDTDAIDKALQQQSCAETYLQSCKMKRRRTSSAGTCQPSEDCDVLIVTPTVKSRYKLLQFHTNHRPPYYGTWRKRSNLVSPRNPFRMDKVALDYDVDSDDEWEEEEPGESVSASEDERESGEEEEEDDGFFVPHGYLSDGEGEISDGEGGKQVEQDNQKQMAKAKAWEAEYARKCQPLKPIKIGLVWECDVTMETGGLLSQYTAVPLVPHPVPIGTTQSKGESTTPCTTNTGSRLQAVPEEAISDLIRLVHKSTFGLKKLVKTFRTHWGAKILASRPASPAGSPPHNGSPPQTPKHSSEEEQFELASGISKRQVEHKILSIATKETGPVQHRNCWLVHSALLQEYNLMEDFTPLKVLGVTKEMTDRSVDKLSGKKVAGKGYEGPKAVKTLKQFFSSPTQKKPVASRQLEIVPILSVSPAKKMKISVNKSSVAVKRSQPEVIVISDKTSQQSPHQTTTDCINI